MALHFPNERRAHVQSLIDQGISQFVPRSASAMMARPIRTIVLLTGSTGALGSNLLAYLLKDPRVLHVYTLNRSGFLTIEERQAETFRKLRLDASVLETVKLTSLQGDLTKEDLGLAPAVYEELLSLVSVIIHNAWTLDFKSPLRKFEPMITGSTNLINFARRSHFSSLRFLFTSSITSVQNFGFESKAAETLFMDPRVCLGTGYGESKYVIERILAASNVSGCSVRIPQLYGGGTDGIWPASGWLPIMVQSSVTLGGLFYTGGLVDWLPMDSTAKVLIDFMHHDGELPLVINICHPRPTSSHTIINWIREAINECSQGSVSLSAAPLDLWVANVRNLGDKGISPRELPALKIMAFLQQVMERGKHVYTDKMAVGALPLLDTTLARGLSASLNRIDEIDKDAVRQWIACWIKEGFLMLKSRDLSRL